jgi:hypothetical protein
MGTRDALAQTHHDAMLAKVVAKMREENFTDIRAEIEDLEWPSNINGYRPDASGVENGTLHLVEVETADSLGWTHTAEQWRAFSPGLLGSHVFVVVVPPGSSGAAETLKMRLGITARVIEIDITK